jgi:predicted phage terminase large subunit-like protein
VTLRDELLALPREERRRLVRTLAPIRVPYCPLPISAKQEVFLRLCDVMEVFYGGAGGGGKSIALLMGALRWVHVPGFAALILRRTFPQLNQDGGLKDVARRWLSHTDARWVGSEQKWVFPSGATITFGHVKNPGDEWNYRGGAWQYIAFDELTQFTHAMYTFLFSRLRRVWSVPVPLQMRSASNPGDIGHVWVKKRMIDPRTRPAGTLFVPAKIADNPGLDLESYRQSLAYLPPLLRLQMEHGDWKATRHGAMFTADAVEVVDRLPAPSIAAVRAWDIARSKPRPGYADPDYSVGVRLDRLVDDRVAITRMKRLRDNPKRVREEILSAVRRDGPSVPVWIEMEGGGLAGIAIDALKADIAEGASVGSQTPGADKTERAQPWSNLWMNGRILIRAADWNEDLIDEHESFPAGEHDDIVDACSLGLSKLPRAPRRFPERLAPLPTAQELAASPLAPATGPVPW